MSEICSKLTLNVPEWRHSGVFNVNFEQISHIALVFPLFTFNKLMPVGRDIFYLQLFNDTLASFLLALVTIRTFLCIYDLEYFLTSRNLFTHFIRIISNKANEQSQKIKHTKFSKKMNISYPLLPPDHVGKFAFRKSWCALVSCNTRIEIRPFALLQTK